MSMSVNGYSASANVYTQTPKTASKQTGDATDQADKTDGTGSAQGDSATMSRNDYYSYLSENFDCVANGKVTISPTYLRNCANDPAMAKELEENLACYNACYESGLKAVQSLGKVEHYDHTWTFDKNGELKMEGSVTITSEKPGKSFEETQKELEEKRAEKREEEKLKAEREVREEMEKEFLENLGESGLEVNVSIDVKYAEAKEDGAGDDQTGGPGTPEADGNVGGKSIDVVL